MSRGHAAALPPAQKDSWRRHRESDSSIRRRMGGMYRYSMPVLGMRARAILVLPSTNKTMQLQLHSCFAQRTQPQRLCCLDIPRVVANLLTWPCVCRSLCLRDCQFWGRLCLLLQFPCWWKRPWQPRLGLSPDMLEAAGGHEDRRFLRSGAHDALREEPLHLSECQLSCPKLSNNVP